MADRLACLEIAEATRNLVAEYADIVDRREAEGLARIFAPDAVLTARGQRYEGLAAITAFFTDNFTSTSGPRRHFITNVRAVAVSPRRAECSSYFLSTAADAGDSVFGWGAYLDVVERVDGAFRFTAKDIKMDHRGPLGDGWADAFAQQAT